MKDDFSTTIGPMEELPTLTCPGCGSTLRGNRAGPAGSFLGCTRKCEPCGIAFSNATNRPTTIYRDPLMNIPVAARSGAQDIVQSALNVCNRPSKWSKFGFGTSEDALTWTVFSFLGSNPSAMRAAWTTLGGDSWSAFDPSQASILLWGTSLSPRPTSDEVARQLIRVSDELGEAPQSRSEPDVILDGGETGLIFIEVKYLSGNDLQIGHPHFAEYVDSEAFIDPAVSLQSGMYELARNWRIATEMAGDRPMSLVNLGQRARLLRQQKSLELFTDSLDQSRRWQFRLMDWREFLESWRQHRPGWLTEYLRQRISDVR